LPYGDGNDVWIQRYIEYTEKSLQKQIWGGTFSLGTRREFGKWKLKSRERKRQSQIWEIFCVGGGEAQK
jgi:hypothetical protein